MEHAPWFRDTLAETHEEHATASLVAVLITGALAAWQSCSAGGRKPVPGCRASPGSASS